MTEQIALRFPEGTRDRIKRLARNGESMTAVILCGRGALEGQANRRHHEDAAKDQGKRSPDRRRSRAPLPLPLQRAVPSFSFTLKLPLRTQSALTGHPAPERG